MKNVVASQVIALTEDNWAQPKVLQQPVLIDLNGNYPES